MTMTEPSPLRTAIYYVIPVMLLGTGGSQGVEYYEDSGADQPWTLVNADALDTGAQNYKSDLAMLIQPTVDEITMFAPQVLERFDSSAVLFAGVAKTLNDNEFLPSFYSATMLDGRPAMVISVMKKTTRGVILIFTSTSNTRRADGIPVMKLVASTDPEIKNSTDGTVDIPGGG